MGPIHSSMCLSRASDAHTQQGCSTNRSMMGSNQPCQALRVCLDSLHVPVQSLQTWSSAMGFPAHPDYAGPSVITAYPRSNAVYPAWNGWDKIFHWSCHDLELTGVCNSIMENNNNNWKKKILHLALSFPLSHKFPNWRLMLKSISCCWGLEKSNTLGWNALFSFLESCSDTLLSSIRKMLVKTDRLIILKHSVCV